MDPNANAEHTIALQVMPEVPPVPMAPRVVAGYSLERKLGAGGYGEVWQATGPGGLPKAVKILHGCYDGPQAETELRSLEKVKTLRHPFLLSIERIEVVENRLVVVTELADGSLQQRFEQARKEGQRGIARATLLSYLRDAAEALDFLYCEHTLQHLDIKPDNLLFLSDHVKVGDFGLAKEIGRGNETMINGFTPLYSAPELFEGQPSPSSDQYSLAIVYQHMVTGAPPFSGRTAAQLAVQHLNSKPNLSALAPSDRPAVARALSKNANARFQSCREFIEQLSSRKSGSRRANRTAVSRNPQRRPAMPPERIHSDPGTTNERPVPSPTESNRVSGKTNQDPPSYCPSLIVGIGGLAGNILTQFRQKTEATFQHATRLPALPLLFLDSDQESIQAARDRHRAAHLTADETFVIPLRQTSEYRRERSRHLEWMSRRWLYNIPRSRQVSGIRPLGRLAFVDHHQAIRSTLRRIISRALEPEAVKATQAITDLPFDAHHLNVYIVAATSGGTGGGCALDVSYLIQDLLGEMGIASHAIVGLMLQPPPTTQTSHPVSAANALAFLREWKYFSTPALGYPGDAACGLAASDRQPFDHTYFIPLRDGSNVGDLQQYLPFLAEYLYRNTLTPAQNLFRAYRENSRRSTATRRDDLAIRSFRIAETVERVREDIQREATFTCAATLEKWCDEPRHPSRPTGATGPTINDWTRSLLNQSKLQTDQLATFTKNTIAAEGCGRLETYAQALSEESQMRPTNAESVFQRVDRDFQATGTSLTALPAPSQAATSVRETLAAMGETASRMLRDGIISRLEDPHFGLAGAYESCRLIAAELNRVEYRLSSLAEQIRRDLQSMQQVNHACAVNREPNQDVPEGATMHAAEMDFSRCHRYCMLKLCDTVYRAVLGFVAEMQKCTREAEETLRRTRAALSEARDRLLAATRGCSDSSDDRHDSLRWSRAKSHAERFVERFRGRTPHPLVQLVNGAVSPTRWLRSLRQEAFEFLLEDAGATGIALLSSEIEQLANPTAGTRQGRSQRVFAILPEVKGLSGLVEKLSSRPGDCDVLTAGVSGDLFLACECAGIDLTAYWSELASSHPDTTELASRLHSRIDIEWD